MSVAGSMLRQWQLVSQPAECKENCPSGHPTISIMLLYPFSTLRKRLRTLYSGNSDFSIIWCKLGSGTEDTLSTLREFEK